VEGLWLHSWLRFITLVSSFGSGKLLGSVTGTCFYVIRPNRGEGCDVCDAPCKAELNELMSGIAIRKTESVLEYHTMQISADGANKNGGKLSFDGLGRYAIENDNDIVTINWASSLFSTFRSSPWLLNENTERNCLCP